MVERTKSQNPAFEAIIEGVAEELGIEKERCPAEGVTDSCILVIIGASGDLTQRKLIPGLFHLYLTGGLPEPFLIVGCARTQMSTEDFCARLRQAMMGNGNYDGKTWEAFASLLRYRAIEYDDPCSFEELARELRDLDKQRRMKGNRI